MNQQRPWERPVQQNYNRPRPMNNNYQGQNNVSMNPGRVMSPPVMKPKINKKLPSEKKKLILKVLLGLLIISGLSVITTALYWFIKY